MSLPGSTRLFRTSRFYVLAKTLEALLEIPFKKDIYQLEEDQISNILMGSLKESQET